MSKKKVFLWTVAIIGGLILLLIVLLVGTQTYVKRGLQGRLKESVSDQYKVQYGPRSTELASTSAKRIQVTENIPSLRKLIKKAEINLEVKNCEDTSRKIVDLVNNFSGIIIDSKIQKYSNQAKSGCTILKVPPKDFDTVLLKIKELGEVELERVTGEDVTEEYIDLGARLKNAEVVRDRLLKILEEKAREVKDILEVERELARIGETIEQIKGRMKYLDRQIDLATITVNYYEPKAMAPEPLNIVKRFKETIRTAVEAFINVFNGAIVVIAAILPILIWVFIIILITIIIKKLFIKKS